MRRATFALFALAAVMAAAIAGSASAGNGGGGATTAGTAPKGGTIDPGLEFRETPDADQQISGAHKANHVPTKGIPRVTSTPVAAPLGLTVNFDGVSFADERTADGGNQWSVEPPDQGLCVGNGFVLEAVNSAFQIYTTAGTPASGVMALNPFFTEDHAIIRSTPPVYGTFISDPKCYYDPADGRFFFTVLAIDTDPATDEYEGNSHVFVAVSKTSTPTTNRNDWYIYDLNTTNADPDASVFAGGPAQGEHPGCPCFGDQPLIGADQYGFYITTNEFSINEDDFNGAQLYALSKKSLENGTLKGQAFLNSSLPLEEGVAYSLQPATSPTAADWETAAGGTEYFLSALEFGGPDNRIAEWALTNTSSLDSATPNVKFVGPKIIQSETYAFPPDAEQKAGPTPLADDAPATLGKKGQGPKEHENLIAANDDRMQQVVFADRLLYSGLNTAVKTEHGESDTGAAYFIVRPAISGSATAATLGGAMNAQGYIAVDRNNVLYPAAGVGPDGRGAYTFTVVGDDYYPSAAYVRVTPDGIAGNIGLAGPGQAPADGFTGYRIYGGNGTERWGDYFAGVWSDGQVWLASEYIPGDFGYPPFLANWSTRVFAVTP
jgi:hypothetical protein